MELNNYIKKKIREMTYKNEDNGRLMISLGSSRLDFSKPYYFNGFTKKGVKLSWVNGDTEIKVIGKVEKNIEYNDYAFYTEGWSFIEHFKSEEEDNN
jgi:hypothetical protein